MLMEIVVNGRFVWRPGRGTSSVDSRQWILFSLYWWNGNHSIHLNCKGCVFKQKEKRSRTSLSLYILSIINTAFNSTYFRELHTLLEQYVLPQRLARHHFKGHLSVLAVSRFTVAFTTHYHSTRNTDKSILFEVIVKISFDPTFAGI